MVSKVELPSWGECFDKENEGESLTPLERFICDNEPAGLNDETLFRKQLRALVVSLTKERV